MRYYFLFYVSNIVYENERINFPTDANLNHAITRTELSFSLSTANLTILVSS